MAGIIKEGNDVLEEDFEGAVMDACLIASGQRAELRDGGLRYVHRRAEALGLTEVAQLVGETLAEEKAADQKLSALAEGDINEAATADDNSDEEDAEDAPAPQASASASAKSAKTAKSVTSRRRPN